MSQCRTFRRRLTVSRARLEAVTTTAQVISSVPKVSGEDPLSNQLGIVAIGSKDIRTGGKYLFCSL